MKKTFKLEIHEANSARVMDAITCLAYLGHARAWAVRLPQTRKKILSAIKSCEGALRNAKRFAHESERRTK